MALITLILLTAFVLLYVSKSLSSKPEFITKAVAWITAHIDMLAFWGIIYALIAMILVPFTNWFALDIFARLFANIMIIVLALPFSLEKILAKWGANLNAAIVESLRDLVGGIVAREKTMGYVGAGAALLLFAVFFR